jgi:hypothetical protein
MVENGFCSWMSMFCEWETLVPFLGRPCWAAKYLSVTMTEVGCARMKVSLRTIRDRKDFRAKMHFRLVKQLRFETESNALKSMISQS